jgi:putative DNA primase/helicase
MSGDNTPNEPVDRKVEIERLASLNVIDYETARAKAAERLGLRAHVLDKQVIKTRRALGQDEDADDRQGRLVKITDVMPWHERVDGDRLLTELALAVKTYAVLPDHAADAIALWILHTWVVNQFSISPRLAVTSPTKGCGKTTIIRILNKVTRRPKRAGNISPPALFRAMEQFQPTILLDETEKYIEHGSDLHALMNEGHCKGATVMRVLGDKLELIEFAIFGAAAFCRNGKIPDDLEQRSIVIEMQRRLPGEPLAELRDDRAEALDRIAKKCARWADNNGDALREADPDMGGLINRIADNWRPLYAIADLIAADWPERARRAASALAPRESDSTNTQLLADIKAVFDERTGDWADRIFSEMLIEALAGMEGHPWAEYGKARKPITKNQLAGVLGSFHVTPATVQIGTKTLKGYYRHQFNDAWERYLALQGVSETSQRQNPTAAGTSGAFRNVSDESVLTDEKCEKPPSNGHSDGLTFREGDNAPACAQCGAGGDDLHQDETGVWLHPECARFWKPADVDDLQIPGFLDRRQQPRGASMTSTETYGAMPDKTTQALKGRNRPDQGRDL